MERAVASRLVERDLTLAVAESLTGGLVASRLVGVEGASGWFRGGVVSYAPDVKFSMLGVAEGPVVSHQAAEQMAVGVTVALRSDVGLSLTGVAGPLEEEGIAVGTVFVGLAIKGSDPATVQLRLPGDRNRIREYATISSLDFLRRTLDATRTSR
jgi:nicotinamide-nucleotide amidase